jgi:hypothetical protein
MTTLDLDARGVTDATPASLRELVASHGGIVARKEIGHISRLPSDSETKESPWSVAGRWLGDLGPSYDHRPEDHAIDGEVIYAESPPTRTETARVSRTERVRWAWIPGPDLWDRLNHGRD